MTMRGTTLKKMAKLVPYKPWKRYLKDLTCNRVQETLSVDEVDTRVRGTPVEPWAFIRVMNEIMTIDASLSSIKPIIEKGVIAYNDCTDGTEEYILDFCSDNKGFIPFKYPYSVYPPAHEAYKMRGQIKNKLHSYYNAAFRLIPKNQWVIKIDCDHVYITEKLKKTFYLPQNENDCVAYSRLNLHIHNGKVYVLDEPFVEPMDHWLVFNSDMKFRITKGYLNNKFFAYEIPTIYQRNIIYTELTNYHFPFMKKHRPYEGDAFDLMPFNAYKKIAPLNRIDQKLLDEEKIIKIYEKFYIQ